MIAAWFSVWYEPNLLKLFHTYEILKAGVIGVVWVIKKDVVDWAIGAAGGVLAVVGITVAGSIPRTIKFFIIYYNKFSFKWLISLVNYNTNLINWYVSIFKIFIY